MTWCHIITTAHKPQLLIRPTWWSCTFVYWRGRYPYVTTKFKYFIGQRSTSPMLVEPKNWLKSLHSDIWMQTFFYRKSPKRTNTYSRLHTFIGNGDLNFPSLVWTFSSSKCCISEGSCRIQWNRVNFENGWRVEENLNIVNTGAKTPLSKDEINLHVSHWRYLYPHIMMSKNYRKTTNVFFLYLQNRIDNCLVTFHQV